MSRHSKPQQKDSSLKQNLRKDLILEGARVERLSKQLEITQKNYRVLLQMYEVAKREMAAARAIRETDNCTIVPKLSPQGGSEATAFIIASDWHVEETVAKETINGLNEFSLDIGDKRIQEFWQTSARMVKIFGKDIAIKHIVLGLLGDFISGHIHEELCENNSLLPFDALLRVQGQLIGGIHYLLDNTTQDINIVCHSGNHARATKRIHHATEAGNSLEYFMYHNIAEHFKNVRRVKFTITRSYHSYVSVYDLTVRLHHGHNLKYQGGIGGLYIPVNKAIAQWNKGRKADIDVFGHWHQLRDGGNFLCNGSIIGFNAYALSIKAEFERPKQLFFLVDKTRGRTLTAPIVFSV